MSVFCRYRAVRSVSLASGAALAAIALQGGPGPAAHAAQDAAAQATGEQPAPAPGPKPKQFEGNKPALVAQAADGSFTLPASGCEVFGKTLEYMKEDRALGFWNSADDRAAWTIEVAKPGKFEVWFEWSCADSSAGNTFLLKVGKSQVKGKVPSTKKWENHEKAKFGEIELHAGPSRLEITAVGAITDALYDLREVRLVPVGKK